MSIKNSAIIQRVSFSIKTYCEYLKDAKNFSRHNMINAKIKGDFRYRILLIVHGLEKGMCMSELRPFGQAKVSELICLIKEYPIEKHNEFEYRLGVSMLKEWADFFKSHHWDNDPTYIKSINFINLLDSTNLYVGSRILNNPYSFDDFESFSDVLLSRFSIRNFKEKEISDEDLYYALDCFRKAPSACNRQMCRVVQVLNKDVKCILNKTVMGVSGFNLDTINYFLITYDMSAFHFYGERNQGYFNAGLAAMQFVNGLHARGVGSCFLQWANTERETKKIQQILNLEESEKIAVVIGAGYYLERNIIPCSCRRSVDDVIKRIE